MSRFLTKFLKKDREALARFDARGTKGSVVPSCMSIVTRVLFPRLMMYDVVLHAQVSVSGVPQTYCIQYLFSPSEIAAPLEDRFLNNTGIFTLMNCHKPEPGV